jgi:chemotaxis protein CheD
MQMMEMYSSSSEDSLTVSIAKESDMEVERPIMKYYLNQGMIFVSSKECMITTVLGSCISICLWDPSSGTGGMNHYMLPLWNGEGLPSARYGNIAIPKLIEKMIDYGCEKGNLRAKVFGGGELLSIPQKGEMSIGTQNIILAEDILNREGIQMISKDFGGTYGRRIQFNTMTGIVLLKRFKTKAKTQATKRIRPAGYQ